MVFLLAGFALFCVGGTLFQKGAIDRSPGEVVSVSLGAHALSGAGIMLMTVGGLVMMAAGI
jgi:hypothetical protein